MCIFVISIPIYFTFFLVGEIVVAEVNERIGAQVYIFVDWPVYYQQ